MYHRTDEADAVIAVAGDYFKAMVDADEVELRRVFHPQASVIGHFAGVFEFASLDEFIAGTPDAKIRDKAGPGFGLSRACLFGPDRGSCR